MPLDNVAKSFKPKSMPINEDADDLALALKGGLFSRRFGKAVRLEVADNCPQPITPRPVSYTHLTLPTSDLV